MPSGEGVLERDLETAHLQRALDHSWHGVGRVVVIQGPAGIGKTTLIGAAREMASATGMNVRHARGSELEQSFPFGVVRQLFDPLLAAATEAQRDEWLSGAAKLASPLFDARAVLHKASESSVYPLLHGLYWLCCNLARAQPLALCVDDGHWVDEPSLAFLGFLARRLDELPILVVLAARPLTASPPEGLAALVNDPAARVLAPHGLSEQAVERLLAAEVDGAVEEQFVRACHEATAGNPFLLGELVKELRELGIAPTGANAARVGSLGSQRVAESVLIRLARLSPGAPALARAVAILGDGASIANAAALAGVGQEIALGAAAAMRAAELIGDEAGLSFAHPIIRAAIYRSILPAERALRHAQAASLLHERGAPAEHVAAQILLADDVAEPWALDELDHAATSALAMGAPRSAAAYLRRALALAREQSHRAALLARLGHAEVLAGLPEASEDLETAVQLTSDPDERARVALALAQLLKYTGRVPRAVELLSELSPPADERLRTRVETEMLSGALMSHAAHGLLAERLARLDDRRARARDERERVELIVLAFERMNANAPKSELLDLLGRAGIGASSSGETVLLPPALMTAAATLSYLDEFDQADGICSLVIGRARRRGALTSLLVGLAMRAQVAYRRGDLGGALADAETALRLATDVAGVSTTLRLHPQATINNVAVEQHRSESELEELLESTDRSLHRDTLHGSLTLLSRARLLLALGRPEAALEQLLELGRLPSTFATGAPAFIAWRSDAALIMHRLGDQAGARRLAAEELELARAMGAARATGIALRAYALVDDGPAVDVLREAVSVLERSPARLERARALVDLGAAMRRGGERAAARRPLHEGHDEAVLSGATQLAERARREIAATGARVAPAGAGGIASLTPSERRVAELAARGHTNREIAQTLFVSEKTVETHLGHVYDKLGVRSRHKLEAALVPAAPTPA